MLPSKILSLTILGQKHGKKHGVLLNPFSLSTTQATKLLDFCEITHLA
jgi:hypothetical protein